MAQILLTGEDLHDEKRYGNFSNTMGELLRLGVLPIINENDTVSTGEIAVGDNDTLGAKVAVSVHADLLILLSDIEGLYTADPHKDAAAKLISRVEKITPEIEALAGGSGTERGTGGMKTKLSAAKICAAGNCETVIANGATPAFLYRIVNGEDVGTRFCCGR